jgi:catechol 2,3-dioxygenase-like lactoylglutathione lyase family enzyme
MDSSTRKLLEDFESGRISRRQLLRALGLAAAAAVPARLIGQQPQTPPAGRGGGGGGGRGGGAAAAPAVPTPRPFADTGWKTVWLDKLEYQCVDPEKAAGFYVALMNWRVRSHTHVQPSGAPVDPAPTGTPVILLDMGEAQGGIEFRGGYTPPPAGAGGGGGGGGGNNRPPLLARFTGFAWGIDQWDPARVRAALQQRGLNPVEANSEDGTYQSFRFKDPWGFDVAVTNGTKANRRARLANGHLVSPLPFDPTYWTTLYVDHISYSVPDVPKAAGFYAALLGWNVRDAPADTTQMSVSMGDGGIVAGAIFRGGNPLAPPAPPRGGGAGAAGGGGGGGGRGGGAGAAAAQPASIGHISFGMKDWNTAVFRHEFVKRGLTPRNDFQGNLQSYHVPDAQGWDLQVGNKIGPSTWSE